MNSQHTIQQICSHLLPSSLWRLAFVNKRMHAALTSDSGAAMWRSQLESPKDDARLGRYGRYFVGVDLWRRKEGGSHEDEDGDVEDEVRAARKKACEERRLPLEDGKPINPLKLSAFHFAQTCQVRSRSSRVYRTRGTLSLRMSLDLRQACRLPQFRTVGIRLLRLLLPRGRTCRRDSPQRRFRRPAPLGRRTRENDKG